MLKELARPVALFFCLLAVLTAFHRTFFDLETGVDNRFPEMLGRLGLAGAVCLVSGWLFEDERRRWMSTLPVQLFYWLAGVMGVLFAVARYVEGHHVFPTTIHY